MSTLHQQRGSALVEGFLISGVLVTFMIGIPMMGSLVDLKQNTIQASRYAAWEKTVQKNSVKADDNIDARFFKDATATIQTHRPGEELLGSNVLWGELRDTEQPASAAPGATDTAPGEGTTGAGGLQLYQRARVTADTANVGSVLMENAPDSNLNVYYNVGKAVSTVGAFISPDGWDTDDRGRDRAVGIGDDNEIFINGLLSSNIEIKVENNELMTRSGSACVGGGAGCVKASTSILVDGWSAGDPNAIRERVHGFVPTNRLEKVGDLVSKVSLIPMLGDLEHLERAFGCVKLGVRPAKELAAGNLPTYEPVQGNHGVDMHDGKAGDNC